MISNRARLPLPPLPLGQVELRGADLMANPVLRDEWMELIREITIEAKATTGLHRLHPAPPATQPAGVPGAGALRAAPPSVSPPPPSRRHLIAAAGGEGAGDSDSDSDSDSIHSIHSEPQFSDQPPLDFGVGGGLSTRGGEPVLEPLLNPGSDVPEANGFIDVGALQALGRKTWSKPKPISFIRDMLADGGSAGGDGVDGDPVGRMASGAAPALVVDANGSTNGGAAVTAGTGTGSVTGAGAGAGTGAGSVPPRADTRSSILMVFSKELELQEGDPDHTRRLAELERRKLDADARKALADDDADRMVQEVREELGE